MNDTTTPAPASEETVAPKIILQGPISTGKSFALRTLVKPGRETFVLQTEPSEVLDDLSCSQGLHLMRAFPAQVDLQTLIQNAQRINTMTMDALQKIQDPNRYKYTQFIDILNALQKFVCYRCKKDFGGFELWGVNRTLAIDGMSGLSQTALDLVCGAKPIRTQPEWGCAMDNLERFLQFVCMNAYSVFVLIAHIERETDETTGGSKNMMATLGRKLAPKLPRYFSDIILTKRSIGPDGKPKYYWSTSDTLTELKNRNLPFSDSLSPDFTPLLATWQGRLDKAIKSNTPIVA